MHKSEALKAVGVLAAIWPARQISEATVQAYAESLVDLDKVELGIAIERMKSTSDFFPSIAALRREATNARPGLELPSAESAWAEVRGEIARVGSKAGLQNWSTGEVWAVKYSHPAIEAAAKAIGWDVLCCSENEEATRAHFMQFYGFASTRISKQQVATPRANELVERLTSNIGKSLLEAEAS